MRSGPLSGVQPGTADVQGHSAWTAIIVLGSAGFSFVFACAAPFAAIGTLAGLKMARREAVCVIGLVWLCNQLIGYGVLRYPWTWDSMAWGLAIGLSSYMALGVAIALSSTQPVRLAISLPFVGAFAAYELGIYFASFVLPGSDGAFDITIVRQLFTINLLALVGLLALGQVASAISSLASSRMLSGAASLPR